ncbi:4-hydroxyphenylpyruvate dioxygenase [Chitinasiproducens palmae]|uniref:4-hydroxyphenylpyruvate dioxygenase n=1 Tax=Chitinasiproducens palmae TaxID=1770053 RepID=A0A1H2PLW3_9BURK|nr:4-hydroxyphenylpyruvate dioxygenase [Chitinasiproducens palmae]SDV47029.1 4-hydroxyphenylpyruvate dioxygenase [Chitinasiproducens palmae]
MVQGEAVDVIDTAFMEFASRDLDALVETFERLGFKAAGRHRAARMVWMQQGGVTIIANGEPGTHGARFAAAHGPACAGMAFLVADSADAIATARGLGAESAIDAASTLAPGAALRGIGDSALYLVDGKALDTLKSQFELTSVAQPVAPFLRIDHVTHCVHPGHMAEWVAFYKRIFGFEEVFKFVAGDAQNGFDTVAVRAPGNAACVTVIEPMGAASQIQAFIDEYCGEGIQHLALASGDLYRTVERLTNAGIDFLPTPAAYYAALDERVPGHGEDVAELQRLNMLLDGANTGENPDASARLLLQIFTRTMVGPIFFEAIQRKGDTSFGEGNAKALFEAIKREQQSEQV